MPQISFEEPAGRKIMKRIGAPCLALGSGTATLGGILGMTLGLHAKAVVVTGGILLSCGIFTSLMGELWFRIGPRMDYYRARLVTSEAELLELQRLSEAFAFGEVSSLAEKRALLAKNRELLYAIEVLRPRRPKKTVGYYALYPLRKVAVSGLEEGKRNRWYGERATPEDICVASAKPTGLYIGFLWGADRKGKAAALKLLGEKLTKRYKVYSAFKVFARPMTDESVRLAKRHRFRKVVDGGIPSLYTVVARLWP